MINYTVISIGKYTVEEHTNMIMILILIIIPLYIFFGGGPFPSAPPPKFFFLGGTLCSLRLTASREEPVRTSLSVASIRRKLLKTSHTE